MRRLLSSWGNVEFSSDCCDKEHPYITKLPGWNRVTLKLKATKGAELGVRRSGGSCRRARGRSAGEETAQRTAGK